MQIGRLLCGLVAAGLLSSATAPGQEARPGKPKPGKELEIGQAAPDFELASCQGKTCRLSDYKDKIVVLEWINQDCPWSRKACPKFKQTAGKYGARGVVWLAIDSTSYQTAERDARYARKQHLPYPILMDTDGRVGHLYGAKTTPHIYVINRGTLVYRGAHDNQKPRRGKPGAYRDYVSEALEAVLAGKKVPAPVTEPYGCTVKYKKGR